MANSKPLIIEAKSTGDRVVDGLLAGLAAGLLMSVYLLLAGLLRQEGPAVTFGRFVPDSLNGPPLSGLLLQLAIAAICGAMFGLVLSLFGGRWPHRLPVWPVSIIYSALLLLLAQAIILPGAGVSLQEFPTLHLALANGLFGLVLGLLLGRAVN
jgi:hypothetical protein